MEKMAKMNYSELNSERVDEFSSTFSLKPLSRGFANTLGTALRRTLLSSITSCAPFAIKINKVEHEFSTIDGIREDVVTLLQNLTKIRFTYNEELFNKNQIVKVSFRSNKIGEVYARDIEFPSGLEIVNKDCYIADIQKDGDLEFDMFLRAGRGFVDFEDNKAYIQTLEQRLDSKIKSGQYLAVDSDFSPVKKISFQTIELNSSSALVEEELLMRVETDGTVEAREALSQASKILIAHLQVIGNVQNIEQIDLFEDEKIEKPVDDKLILPIEKLDLTIRSVNALHRAGYNTIDDLVKLSEDELGNIKNLGKKSVDDIIKKIQMWKESTNKGDE
ncbi:DNA-directed RNA polymerase subunit alpha [Mycoplasma sp. 128]|uniref:DNA-directed RNA polymerase subunit alpha n=1 Tax=Mycoplasma sp. 3341 TaxID=3447506 RepID=UPI003F65FC62